MIIYDGAKIHPRLLFRYSGSVMPFSIIVALPCGILSALLKLASQIMFEDGVWTRAGLYMDSVAAAAFMGFNFLIGFLVVFRAQQAYARFWEGCTNIHAMQGFWFDAASSLCAFTKNAKADIAWIITFQHTLVRLVSLLHSCVLMELCAGVDRENPGIFDNGRAFELELIDAEGLDTKSLKYFNQTTAKVELVFQWVQQLIVEYNEKQVFSVAPPILSRSFQELANGMVNYRQASKIARVPLPFPYVQALELLLISHWMLTPFLMCMWTAHPLWAGVLSFVQVTFFWSLNAIATELENPFGEDVNDLPAAEIQHDFNERLLLLVQPSTAITARLSQKRQREIRDAIDPTKLKLGASGILKQREKFLKTAALSAYWEEAAGQQSSLMTKSATLGQLHAAVCEKIDANFDSEVDPELAGASRSPSRTPTGSSKLKTAGSKLVKEPSTPASKVNKPSKLVKEPSAAASIKIPSPTSSASNSAASTPRKPKSTPHGVNAFGADGAEMGKFAVSGESIQELVEICRDVREEVKNCASESTRAIHEVVIDIRDGIKAIANTKGLDEQHFNEPYTFLRREGFVLDNCQGVCPHTASRVSGSQERSGSRQSAWGYK